MRAFTLFVFLVSVVLITSLNAKVIVEFGYENETPDDGYWASEGVGEIVGFNEPDPNGGPDRIAVSQDYARVGDWSLRSILRYGDLAQDGTGSRTESHIAPLDPRIIIPGGNERWFGFSILIPPDFQYDSNGECLFQVKQHGTYPFFSVYTDKGNLGFFRGYDESGTGSGTPTAYIHTYLCPYETGVWYDFVMHVVPTWQLNDGGELQFWYKKATEPFYQMMADYSGPTLISTNMGYAKWGVYKATWDYQSTDSTERKVYHDCVIAGTCFSEVARTDNFPPKFVSNEFLNPVAYYSFDNPLNLGVDNSGNGSNLLTSYTTAPEPTTGVFGGAADFDGASDGYDILLSSTSPQIYVDGPYSVAFWAAPDEDDQMMMVSMPSSSNGGFSVFTYSGAWRIASYDGSGTDTLNSYFLYTVGQFDHIVYTYEVTSGTGPYSGTGTIYVNGFREEVYNDITYTPGGYRFGLGNRAGGSYHFDGAIDEFAIFNEVLSPEQAWDLANATTPDNIRTGRINEVGATEGQAYASTLYDDVVDLEGDTLTFSKVSGPAWLTVAGDGSLSGTPGGSDVGLNEFVVQVTDINGGADTAALVISVNAPPYFVSNDYIIPAAYYSFDNSAALNYDDSGNGSDLLNTYATAPDAVAGILDGAANFDGTSDGYDIKLSNTSPAIYPDGAFTVSGWLKAGAASASGDCVSRPASSLGGGFAIVMYGSPILQWYVVLYDGSGSELIDPDTSVLTDQWTHLAFTFAPTSGPDGNGVYNGNVTVYIDGVQTNTQATTYAQDGYRFGLGNRAGGTSFFDGTIDEFAIFSTVLSSEQITELAGTATPADITTGKINEIDAVVAQAYSSTLTNDAVDPESATLTFSKISGPAWLSVAANGLLSGTPAAGDVGLNVFNVQVSDGDGGIDTTTLNILVNNN